MATATKQGVSFKMDERSLRSFKRQCNLLVSVVGENSVVALEEYCEKIELDAIENAPTDTGTVIRSIGRLLERTGEGWRARVGVGVSQNHVNPRTGKLASSYAGKIHESGIFNGTGDGKFLEMAISSNSEGFVRRSGEVLSETIAKANRGSFTPIPRGTSREGTRSALINSKIAEGFTAKVLKGKTLPYPLGGRR